MIISLILLIVGFLILTFGAEFMVRGSSAIALKLGISPLLIGLTIVAMGTSAPELAVSIESALTGRSSIALGNVVGSNIANIGLILGLTALISTIALDLRLIKKQIPMLIGASILTWVLLLDQMLSTLDGLLLATGFFAFLYYSYLQARQDQASASLVTANPVIVPSNRPVWLHAALTLFGLGLLIYGSTLFVESAVDIAVHIGISEAVIGLTIVAIGTSIPELATSLVAAWRRESDIAVGNIIGSNLFNILGILGITAVVRPVNGAEFNSVDFMVMVGYAVILLPFALTGLKISRLEGSILLAGYLLYMGYLVFAR
ncbi:MAG: calcium/sodium antiporter [Pseudohongiellaceae bacterium]